jgi:hypothetical protein
MSANVQPQFCAVANISSVLFGGAALTTSDGSSGTVGTNIFLAFTPGANGSYIEVIRIMAVASAAATATAATTVRIYISTVNTGSTTTSNTWLFNELALPAITADQTTTATNFYDVPCGFRIGSANYILISSHIVNNANTSLRATTFGGDY